MLNKTILLATTISMMFAFGCRGQTTPNNDSVNSSKENGIAKDTSENKNIFYVDVRTPAEFAQGSVSGSVNIPVDQVQARIAEFQGKEEIVVFCRSGNRSAQAKTILEKNGIKNVTNGGSWENVKKK